MELNSEVSNSACKMTKCWFVVTNHKCTKYAEGDYLTDSGFGDYMFAKPFSTEPNLKEIARDFHIGEDELITFQVTLEDWHCFLQQEEENDLQEEENLEVSDSVCNYTGRVIVHRNSWYGDYYVRGNFMVYGDVVKNEIITTWSVTRVEPSDDVVVTDKDGNVVDYNTLPDDVEVAIIEDVANRSYEVEPEEV